MKFKFNNKFGNNKSNDNEQIKYQFLNKHIIQTSFNINRFFMEFLVDYLLRYIIIIYLVKPINSIKNRRIKSYSSIITLKIKGIGYENILNSSFDPYPDQINLNEKIIDNPEKKEILLERQENIIKLKWNENIKSCKNMFSGLSNLIDINFTNFDTSEVTEMEEMFRDCSSLTSLDLSNFNTNLVSKMSYMFANCSTLISLDLSNFKTSSVKDIYGIFKDCYSLKFLNIANLDTSSSLNMMYFFYNCYSLTSLNLYNFDTSLVTYMFEMFYNCNQLVYLNVSSFNTSLVSHMHYMFFNCTSLKSLDISNFNTSSVQHLYSMFLDCSSLTSIYLSNFDTSKVEKMHNMFSGCNSLTSLNLSKFDTSNVQTMGYMFNNCKSLISLDLSNFNTEKVTDMTKMFYGCQNLEFLNIKNFNNSNCNKFKEILKGTPENLVFCIDNENSVEILEALNNKVCSNNNCSYIWADDKFENEFYKQRYSYKNNCVEVCPEGTYTDKDIYICKYCHAKNFFNDLCHLDFDNINERENIIKTIVNEITDKTLDDLISNMLKGQQDILIKKNNTLYQITTLTNQVKISQDNNNISSINFGNCEKILKTKYNIGKDEELILFKIEYYLSGFNIPIIEYQIFSSEDKINLNLNYCKNISVEYYVPVSIDETEIYKYNSSSDYYNDRCYTFTTKNGTDISIYDRKNEFNKNNLSLCENNCVFKEYNFTLKKVKCECKIKEQLSQFSDIIILEKELLYNFINLKEITNFWVIKCINLIFSKEGLDNNIGNYILLVIIAIIILKCIYFYIKGMKSFFKRIGSIIEQKLRNINNSSIINLNEVAVRKKKRFKICKRKINYPPKKRTNKKHKTVIENKSPIPKNIIDIQKKKLSKEISIFVYNNTNSNSKLNKKLSPKNKTRIIDYNFNDYELNSLCYEDALKFDKRTFFEYYISLIKVNQLIIFSFCLSNDYNSKIIKICFFQFIFALYYILNALFFTDSTMHKIYENKGEFDFIYQLPQIIYSTLISILLKQIISMLCLTEKDIVKIKKKETFELSLKMKKTIIKCIKIKFILFFTFVFFFLLIFWYYISCFCAIYKNTQVYLIKNTMIGFVGLLIYPFIIYLIPGIFRIPALLAEKKDKQFLFKLSKIAQII